MSEQPATLEGTRRRAAGRCATAAVAAIACVSLTVLAIVAAPSPAIVVALCACAVATGVLAPGGVTGGRLVLQVRRRRLAPIRPSARRALAEFRRELDALPETTHPIGR